MYDIKKLKSNKPFQLPETLAWPPAWHVFSENELLAIKAAIAVERPLLIRGEPGIGKSQLARAAAYRLQVPFLSYVINSKTECTDLLYTYDAVSRLARAQVLRAGEQTDAWKEELQEKKFIRPEVLWWALNWEQATDQCKLYCSNPKCQEHKGCCSCCGEPDNQGFPNNEGCVVLIDEIDKADSDLANGLLESLGNNGFQIPETKRVIRPKDVVPLVIITTNEERELPAAFLRRCLVVTMALKGGEEEQKQQVIARGRVHYKKLINDATYKWAVDRLFQDREKAEHHIAKPGVAEYLDLLKILSEMPMLDEKEKDELACFTFQKNAPDGLR